MGIKPQRSKDRTMSQLSINRMLGCKFKWLIVTVAILLAEVLPEIRKAHRIPPDAPLQPKAESDQKGDAVIMQKGQ